MIEFLKWLLNFLVCILFFVFKFVRFSYCCSLFWKVCLVFWDIALRSTSKLLSAVVLAASAHVLLHWHEILAEFSPFYFLSFTCSASSKLMACPQGTLLCYFCHFTNPCFRMNFGCIYYGFYLYLIFIMDFTCGDKFL